MTALNEGNYLNDLLQYELDKMQSREQVTVAQNETLVMGEVVGKVTKSTPTTGTKADGATGGGNCTAVTAGAKALVGTYTLECTAVADASAGTGAIFQVKNPEGVILPPAEADVAYTNDQLNFTINTAGAAYIVGDIFTVAVAAGSGQIKAIAFDAVDGTQDAYGISIDAYGNTTGTEQGVLIVRDAQIVADYLTWPDGATSGEKAAALAQLYAKGIVTRTEA